MDGRRAARPSSHRRWVSRSPVPARRTRAAVAAAPPSPPDRRPTWAGRPPPRRPWGRPCSSRARGARRKYAAARQHGGERVPERHLAVGEPLDLLPVDQPDRRQPGAEGRVDRRPEEVPVDDEHGDRAEHDAREHRPRPEQGQPLVDRPGVGEVVDADLPGRGPRRARACCSPTRSPTPRGSAPSRARSPGSRPSAPRSNAWAPITRPMNSSTGTIAGIGRIAESSGNRPRVHRSEDHQPRSPASSRCGRRRPSSPAGRCRRPAGTGSPGRSR